MLWKKIKDWEDETNHVLGKKGDFASIFSNLGYNPNVDSSYLSFQSLGVPEIKNQKALIIHFRELMDALSSYT